MRAAFDRVFDKLRSGGEDDEYAVQQFIVEQLRARRLVDARARPSSASTPTAPTRTTSRGRAAARRSRRGDFLLIDLFAKEKAEGSVYADITWCGVCAPGPTDRQEEMFRAVAGARDAALELVTSRYPTTTVRGYEVDDAARQVIVAPATATASSTAPATRSAPPTTARAPTWTTWKPTTRGPLLPMTGFSIEPGIYFEGDFGVRLEINVALTAERAEVTGAEPQRELLRL